MNLNIFFRKFLNLPGLVCALSSENFYNSPVTRCLLICLASLGKKNVNSVLKGMIL